MTSITAKGSGLRKFDASEFLNSPEDCAAYLQEFIGTDDDQALLLSAIGDVLKAQRKMTYISKELGISREGLYKSLGDNGNPSFHTIAHILKLLGLGISIKPIESFSETAT